VLRSQRWLPIAGWANAAVSLGLVAWTVPVAVQDGLTWPRFLHEQFGFSVVLVATMPVLGAFLVSRHPENRLGWLFCAYGPLRGVSVVADVWAHHTYMADPGSWPGGPVAAWLFQVGPLFLLPTVPLTLLWFPDGRAPAGRWHRVELASAVAVALLAGLLVFSWPFRGRRLLAESPSIGGWRGAAADGSATGMIVVVLLAVLVGFASLVSRLRQAEPIVRAQVKCFLYGAGAAFVLNVAGDVRPGLAVLRVAAVAVLEIFIVVAIERYRVWEIDRLINRTLVYGTLSALAAGVYVSAVLSIGLVVGGTRAGSPLAVAGATLLLAVLFAPTRQQVQRAVDRRFDRRTFDAVTRVRAFIEQLGPDSPRAGGLEALLAEVLHDPGLVLCFTTTNGRCIDHAGRHVEPPTQDDDRCVTVLGGPAEPIGFLGHRRALRSDGHLLRDVLATAKPAVEYARMHAELQVQLVAMQASRVRLVEATDAERRRIERDLHDGAQQRLLALALRVRTEQHRQIVEPGTNLDSLLSTTVTEIQTAVAELRSMTHGLLPPVLTSGGTAPALRELVGRYDGSATLLAVPDHRHVAIVEATSWFVASEGLANAMKHAGSATVTLRAECREGVLRVAVCDDGPGGATLAGSGLRGLRDRVDACGGHLSLHSPPGGGTELSAALPCE
jgi:signal transduction histidine kinase